MEPVRHGKSTAIPDLIVLNKIPGANIGVINGLIYAFAPCAIVPSRSVRLVPGTLGWELEPVKDKFFPYDDENNYKCMKYKNFERNSVTQAIEYPKNNKVTEPIKDHCIKKKHSNYCRDIVEDTDCELNSTKTGCQLPGGTSATNAQCKFNNTLWTALYPYYYSKKCQDALRPSDTS